MFTTSILLGQEDTFRIGPYFLRWSEIAFMQEVPGEVRLELCNGSRLTLPNLTIDDIITAFNKAQPILPEGSNPLQMMDDMIEGLN